MTTTYTTYTPVNQSVNLDQSLTNTETFLDDLCYQINRRYGNDTDNIIWLDHSIVGLPSGNIIETRLMFDLYDKKVPTKNLYIVIGSRVFSNYTNAKNYLTNDDTVLTCSKVIQTFTSEINERSLLEYASEITDKVKLILSKRIDEDYKELAEICQDKFK